MRKFFLLIALLGLALALAACAGGEKAAPAGETPGAGLVSIDLWHSEPAANEETLKQLASRFNATHENIRVRPVYQGGPGDVMTKLMAATGSGQVPAIAFLMETFIQRMIDSGTVAPIQDFVDREDYDLSDLDEKAVQYYSVEDKLWGMPFCVDIPLLYYNKKVFREVGLDAERPPQDLEEVRQYSQKILKRDASGNVVRSGIALHITLWTEQIFAQQGDLLVDKGNGREGRATKVLFDNDTGRRFFQWWHDTVDQGLTLNVGRNPSGADNYIAVATDRAAMTFGYAGALRSIVNALERGELAMEIGVGAVPGLPGGSGASLLLGHGLWILGLRPEREQEAAWEFVRWLTEPEQQAEWFAGSGCLPVSRSSVDLPAARDVVAQYPLFQTALDLFLNAPLNPASLGVVLGPFPEMRDAIERALEEMLSGDKEPMDALEDAAATADEILAEYNEKVD